MIDRKYKKSGTSLVMYRQIFIMLLKLQAWGCYIFVHHVTETLNSDFFNLYYMYLVLYLNHFIFMFFSLHIIVEMLQYILN